MDMYIISVYSVCTFVLTHNVTVLHVQYKAKKRRRRVEVITAQLRCESVESSSLVRLNCVLRLWAYCVVLKCVGGAYNNSPL